MKTDNLRINQLSEPAYQWYLAYLTALDNKDVAAYGAYIAPDCEMLFGNAPPVRGKDAILAALGAYWQTFGSLEHDLLNVYGSERAFVLEALNHYTRKDNGKPVTLRAVAFTDRNPDGLVTSFRLYTDTGPLFAPAEEGSDDAHPSRD